MLPKGAQDIASLRSSTPNHASSQLNTCSADVHRCITVAAEDLPSRHICLWRCRGLSGADAELLLVIVLGVEGRLVAREGARAGRLRASRRRRLFDPAQSRELRADPACEALRKPGAKQTHKPQASCVLAAAHGQDAREAGVGD